MLLFPVFLIINNQFLRLRNHPIASLSKSGKKAPTPPLHHKLPLWLTPGGLLASMVQPTDTSITAGPSAEL
ncbi:uncharacterized protein BDV14DRAFT_185039 [Aspergillus stella-maris]|uniref:uncharacterized protein n=1 Tax=Aspergillus stella-maris TaxID=1810926 RepID=UPI003CCCD9BA